MAAASVSAAFPPMKLEQLAVANAATPAHASRRTIDPARERVARSASDLLFDTSGLAAEVAQIIELGPADIATSFHLDFSDGGAVRLKHALYALAVRNLSDRKRRVEPPVPLCDHDAFVGLQPLAIAFRHPHLHHHGVARRKVGNVLLQLLLFYLVDNPGHTYILCHSRSVAVARNHTILRIYPRQFSSLHSAVNSVSSCRSSSDSSRFASNSGRLSQVRPSACFNRQRLIAA